MTSTARPRAKKALGQHWLTDRRILARIAEAAEIAPGETVIEIGPGTGLLTEQLAARAGRLIAVEMDDALALRLQDAYRDAHSVRVLHRDVLEVTPEEILAEGGGSLPYVVVGNLPYNIGTVIVRRFLRARVAPRSLVVTLQQEVAERMCAGPGRMTYLGAETQVFAEARLLFGVPPRAFRPPPKVRSAVVRLDVRDSPDVEVDDLDAFLEFLHAGFAAPRKHLRNSLAVGLRSTGAAADAILAGAGVEPAQRPADLDLTAWRNIYYAYRTLSRDVDARARQD